MNEVEIIQHPQIGGLRLFFDTVDYRTPHDHPEWELLWVLAQPLAVTCGPAKHQLCPGQMVLFNPGQLHEFHQMAGSCTFLCLQIAPQCFAQSFPELERISVDGIDPQPFWQAGEAAWAQRTLLACMRAYLEQPPCYELFCLGQVSLLLHSLLTRMPTRRITAEEAAERERRSARMARLLAYVDQNYMHKIRLSDFARAEGRSMSYLSHFVKETLNQSFQEYVNTVRFNCACKLIASGQQKMLDVCMASGFSDYRYFSKTFQQRLGMTPEAYSRRRQAPDERKVHHSLHSLERFYSRAQSLALLETFEAQYR